MEVCRGQNVLWEQETPLWMKCPPGKGKGRQKKGCSFLRPKRQGQTESSLGGQEGARLVCAACRHVIADASLRVEMAGTHIHGFTNPHGLYFEIGCFSKAPGCTFDGHASDEFSWFPGYRWRVAACGGCGGHMGWLFESKLHRFVGLILAALEVEEDKRDSN